MSYEPPGPAGCLNPFNVPHPPVLRSAGAPPPFADFPRLQQAGFSVAAAPGPAQLPAGPPHTRDSPPHPSSLDAGSSTAPAADTPPAPASALPRESSPSSQY